MGTLYLEFSICKRNDRMGTRIETSIQKQSYERLE
jgi:hypothetical protein